MSGCRAGVAGLFHFRSAGTISQPVNRRGGGLLASCVPFGDVHHRACERGAKEHYLNRRFLFLTLGPWPERALHGGVHQSTGDVLIARRVQIFEHALYLVNDVELEVSGASSGRDR